MRIFGGINALSGVAVAAISHFFNCSDDGKFMTLASGMQTPMKCYWSAQAELAVGVSLFALGILLMVSRSGEAARALSIGSMVLGAFAILIPTLLIGVCTDMTASCNLIMRPAMVLFGGLVMATSLWSLLASRSRPEVAL